MQITEVRIKLEKNERLAAYCSVTFDDEFVVRDLKIIRGYNGLFVSMPSQKLNDRCPECKCKNHLRAQFCNRCGYELGEYRTMRPDGTMPGQHADVAHPINNTCRDKIQEAVIIAYQKELDWSRHPDYVCTYEDLDEEYENSAKI